MSGSPSLPPLQSSASMTQLPPSPDLKGAASGSTGLPASIPEFSLDSSNRANSPTPAIIRRLRSVARYQNFHPRALACSDTLASYDDSTLKTNDSSGPSSLGAVAGPQGVALFRLSRPHVPLLILSHATNSSSQSSISSLAFEPTGVAESKSTTSSLYLAASRGSGVLVWDASGHSPNPLMGRLGMDQASSAGTGTGILGIGALGMDDTRVTSICWKHSSSMSPPLFLASTTASTMCLWDLRSSTSAFKPSVRFGTTRKHTSTTATPFSPLVQVACSSDSEECATIDSAGIVRIYDVRVTDRVRYGNPVSAFAAHETNGVGIAYFGTQSSSAGGGEGEGSSVNLSRWLTWGVDAPMSSVVVKVWKKSYSGPASQAVASGPNAEDYWDMPTNISNIGSSLSNLRSARLGIGSTNDFELMGQCVRPNLACARVCPSALGGNQFIAVGHLTKGPTTNDLAQEAVDGWWAELYSINEHTAETVALKDSLSDASFGLEKVAGFHGGDATSSSDKTALVSILGNRTSLGSLQAAELALSSVVRDKKVEDEVELLLCCLSDTGVVTTHVVPEAMPKLATIRTTKFDGKDNNVPRSNFIRTAFPSTNQARVYPEDREGNSLFDAASYWGVSRNGGDSGLNRADEKRFGLEPSLPSPQNNNNNNEDPLGHPNRRLVAEGGLMPFDMEVPVAYGSVTAGNIATMQLGITDISTGAIVTSTGMGGVIIEEGGPVSVDSQKTSVMQNIETERVPCPRLCGAVFGKGNGGLTIFHNGEVKKMWSWYQRTDSLRLSNVTNGRAESTKSEQESLQMVHNATGLGSTHPLSTRDEQPTKLQATRQTAPRTLKELTNMMAAAKEAQWGDENLSGDSDSDDILSLGDNFFEDDESLGSNSSDEEDDGMLTPPPTDEMYKRYFGGQPWEGTGDTPDSSRSPPPSRPETSLRSPGGKKTRTLVGPSSDMLAPVVRVTHNYDQEMLSHQSIELAKGWKLGPWDVVPTELPKDLSLEQDHEESKSEASTPEALIRKGLPHYRYLLNAHGGESVSGNPFIPMSRTKSDGYLGRRYQQNDVPTASINSQTNEAFKRAMDDRATMLGGESHSSIRPNMEESMTFLKKLFTHQQQEGGVSGFVSPPDNPRTLFQRLPEEHRATSTGHISTYQRTKEALNTRRASDQQSQLVKLGVYTLQLPNHHIEEEQRENELSEIQRICLHNASICAECEDGKEGVWNLLAQTVAGQMGEARKQSFNGWGGRGGGALGVDLVGNVLKYYEALGDCQMLATMTCVLSGGRRRQRGGHGAEGRPFLLPLDQDEKYDMYIRKYADLLYAWDMLSMRAELNKHLVRVPPPMPRKNSADPLTALLGANPTPGSNPPLSGRLEESNTDATTTMQSSGASSGRFPGIAVVFQCPRCSQDTEFNTNVCRNCQDFAFRCSICDNAVHGLFTVCDYCGHGGHVDHMTSWFANHDECPTGCGCSCTFSPIYPKSAEVAAAAAMTETSDFEVV